MSRQITITDSAVIFPSGYLDDHSYASLSNASNAYTVVAVPFATVPAYICAVRVGTRFVLVVETYILA